MSSPTNLTTGAVFDALALTSTTFAGSPKLTAINGVPVSAGTRLYHAGLYDLTLTGDTAFAITAPDISGGVAQGLNIILTLSDGVSSQTVTLTGNYLQTKIVAPGYWNPVSEGPTPDGFDVVDGAAGFVITASSGPVEIGLGESISGAGDVNGDGIDDFIVGAPRGGSQAYVIFGTRSGFPPRLLLDDLNGSNGFRIDYGGPVSGAGDVNGDGIDDLIVGTPNRTGTAAFVLFGSRTGFAAQVSVGALNGRNGFAIKAETVPEGQPNGLGLPPGWSVSAAGDLNHDGYADVIIGAPNVNGPPKLDANGKIIPTLLYGERDEISRQINGASDQTLDTPHYYYGPGETVPSNMRILYAYDDTLAPKGYQYDEGKAYVVFGSASGFGASVSLATLNGTNGFSLSGANIRDAAGYAVSDVGDINGDGIDDVAITATYRLYVVYGKASGFSANIDLGSIDGSNGFLVTGPVDNYVSNAGDVNGDGIDDLVAGHLYSNPSVIFGSRTPRPATISTDTLNGTNGFQIAGVYGKHQASSAGDVNGDGVGDLIVTDDLTTVDIIYGSKAGFAPTFSLDQIDGVSGYRIDGLPYRLQQVRSIAGLGDVNGDGIDDFGIGWNSFGDALGAVTVYYGAKTNRVPVASDDAFTLAEGTTATGNILTNDRDAEDGTPRGAITVLNGPAYGTVSISSSGNFLYTPQFYYNGTDSFTYDVKDSGGLVSNVATVKFTITPVNNKPFAYDDTVTFVEDTGSAFDPLANDYDVEDGRPGGQFVALGNPAHGRLTSSDASGKRVYTYTPNANFNGTDSITYQVSDSGGLFSNIATVTFKVVPVNDAPVAVNDSVTLAEDGSASFDVRANDTDVEDGTPKGVVTIVTGPAHGTLQVVGTSVDGRFVYRPDANYNGTDRFTYSVADSLGTVSNVATVNINVTSVNDAPVARDDSFTLAEDTVGIIDVRANDSDVEDGSPRGAVTIVTGPAHGALTVNSAGSVFYTPTANYNGADSFTYSVKDADGGVSNVATVRLTVTPVNDAPVLLNSVGTVLRDQTFTIAPLSNASDVDGDTVSISAIGAASHGTVTNNGDGTLTYVPAAGFVGEDSFTVTVTDGKGGFGTGTQIVDVARVAPSSRAFQTQTLSGSDQLAPSIAAQRSGNLLVAWQTNDLGTLGDSSGTGIKAKLFNSIGAPLTSELLVNATSTVGNQYTPSVTTLTNGGFAVLWADDNFATDGSGSALQGQLFDGSGVAVGSNFIVNSQTTAGQYEVVAAGLANGGFAAVWRTLDPAQDGSRDGIKGRIFDNTGAGSTEFLVDAQGTGNQDQPAITALTGGGFAVTWRSDDPAQDGDGSAIKGRVYSSAGVPGAEFLVNTAGTGNQIHPAIAGLTTGGFVAIWTTDGGLVGGQVFDPSGAKVGTPFTMPASTAQSTQDSPAVSALLGGGFLVAWTDQSPTRATLYTQTFDASSAPSGPAVTVTLAAPGTDFQTAVSPTPSGGAALSWTTAGTYDTDIATQIFASENAPPSAVADSVTTDEDNPVTVNVLANDSDPNGDTVTVASVTQGANGAVVINSNGTLTYTPIANFNGTDGFSYTVSDGHGGTASAAVSVTVNPVNDAPTVGGVAASLTLDDKHTATPFANAVLADPDIGQTETLTLSLRVAGVATGANGTLSLTGQAGFTLVPAGAGIYQLTGTSGAGMAALQAALRAVVFTPTANQVAPGGATATTVGLNLSDGTAAATASTAASVTSVNDPASITGAVAGAVTEDGTTTVSGQVSVIDPDVGQAVFKAPAASALSGTYGTFTFDAGSGRWSYALNNSSAKVQGLAQAQTVTDKLTVSSVDGTASKDIIVTITGTNDAPVVSAGSTITGSITELVATGSAVIDSASGSIGFTDDLTDTHTASAASGPTFQWSGGTLSSAQITALTTASKLKLTLTDNAGTGSVAWQYQAVDSTFDFLASLQTLTIGYTVRIDDGLGGSVTQPITLTVIGTNDIATIGGTSTAALTEDGATFTASGQLTIADADAGQATFRSPGASALTGTYGTFAFDPATGKWTYQVNNASAAVQLLAQGQVVSDTLTVTSSDGATSQPIKVTITGTNDAPVIGGTKAGQTTTDYVAIKPFASATINDIDAGAQDSVVLTERDALGKATDANGLLSGDGLVKTGVGTYTLAAASPAALTAKLQALTFTPTQAQVAAGKTVTTGFSLAASDTIAITADNVTSVVTTALNYVNGPASGLGLLLGSSGTDVITARGQFNTIFGLGGDDVINAGSGYATVILGDGNASVTLGSGNNLVVGGNGNVTVTGATGGSSIVTLGNGNNTVQLGGTNNTILLGNGTNTIRGTQGAAFITTGSGNDTITLGGSGSTVNAGSGQNTIIGGTGSDTFVLPAAGQGFDLISGFTELNGDVLDLRAALAATTWNRSAATLGNYLSVTNSGGNTNLAIAPKAGAATTAIATLSGTNYGLADLVSHHSIITI